MTPVTEPKQPIDSYALESEIIKALRTVYDPEIPINIYDLGLIYKIHIEEGGTVIVQMTLTTPNCPEAQVLPGTVEVTVRNVPGVNDARVELVWDPPWTKEKMSEEARLVLGLY